MGKHTSHLSLFFQQAFPWLVLTLLILTTYGFFQMPYSGFDFSPSRRQVTAVYVTADPEAALHIGDELVRIGPVLWADFAADLRRTLFDSVQPGQVVPIVVRRDGQTLTVPWVFSGPTRTEVLERLDSQFALAYIFWLAGTVTLLLLRPKDARWRLLIALNYLTAFWIAIGLISRWHLWESSILLHMASWLFVPVYWHLHWVFPQPLGRLPAFVWRMIYLAGGSLAVLEWFQLLPARTYLIGPLLALLGTVVLLVLHFLFRPAQRRDVGLLVVAAALALAPSIAIGIAGAFATFPAGAGVAILTLPALPFAYLYAAYRRQLGGLEIRINRLIAFFTFFILLVSALIVLAALADTLLNFQGKTMILSLAAASIATVLTTAGFPLFQRLVERRVLGMPLPPADLVETYATRIATSLDVTSLVHELRDEVLPTLLVRQSALVRYDDADRPAVLYAVGVDAHHLPTASELLSLLTQAGQVRFLLSPEGEPRPCPWVRLVLPLYLGHKAMGVLLLGRRDPDDYYAQSEIPALQAIAYQTAVALSNILQTERLQTLYRADIGRFEAERASLAWDLHANVLNQLGVLKTRAEESAVTPSIIASYAELIARLRETIKGLHPPMLDYGLYAALHALADDLAERLENKVAVVLELPESDVRYDPQVELHVYRITQQACENALRHARTMRLRIGGRLEPERVDLTVEDNGIGFATGDKMGLALLIAQKHFGLAEMVERAALIQAQLRIDSAPGQGTQVRVTWPQL